MWIKGRQASGILCDKRVPQKLKDKLYRMAIRPAMLYGAECWPTKIRYVQQLSVAEIRMLQWICGHTRMDRVWNDDIRDRLEVALRKAYPTSVEVDWSCPNEASRDTSALWSPKPI